MLLYFSLCTWPRCGGSLVRFTLIIWQNGNTPNILLRYNKHTYLKRSVFLVILYIFYIMFCHGYFLSSILPHQSHVCIALVLFNYNRAAHATDCYYNTLTHRLATKRVDMLKQPLKIFLNSLLPGKCGDGELVVGADASVEELTSVLLVINEASSRQAKLLTTWGWLPGRLTL